MLRQQREVFVEIREIRGNDTDFGDLGNFGFGYVRLRDVLDGDPLYDGLVAAWSAADDGTGGSIWSDPVSGYDAQISGATWTTTPYGLALFPASFLRLKLDSLCGRQEGLR